MARSIENRDIEFRGTPRGALERIVRLPDGREYAHRCSKKVFEDVAGYLDEHHDEGVKIQSVADAIDAPMTTKMQKITLKTVSFACPSPNR